MPKVYCDHNFLIGAFDEGDAYKERLRATRNTRDVALVLSTWHWVEMAKDQNRDRGLDLADFADSLDPSWLRERRRIQATEVAEALFNYIGVPFRPTAPITTMTQVISEMTDTRLE